MHDPASLHASSLVIDTHADTPQRFLDLDDKGEPFDFVTSPLGQGSLNLNAARAGNLAAQFFAIWVDPNEYPALLQPRRAFELLDAVHAQVDAHPRELRLCLTPEDILAARAEGRFAVLLGLEGGHAIADSLTLLRTYHRLGVRYMTLTWSHTTTWADSSGDAEDLTVPHHGGLSPFGKKVIAEMNRIGMMIDISHASDKTLEDVLACSKAPIIASHSSARALTRAPRNLTDNQIRAIASQGGVVMVNFFPAFISEPWRQAWNALKHERDAAHALAAAPYRAAGRPVPFTVSETIDRTFTARLPRPPLADLIDHFMHILQVAGEDHIGIGSDFDGIPETPENMRSAADLPNLTAALIARGVHSETLRKILGKNVLRVFGAIQSAARAG